MANKSRFSKGRRRIEVLSSATKTLGLSRSKSRKVATVTIQNRIKVKPSQHGYVKIKLVSESNDKGIICGKSIVTAKKRDTKSFRLFIAGGAAVDEKVAKANAAIDSILNMKM